MMMNPSTKPMRGEANIGTITFQRRPLFGYQWFGSGSFQMTTSHVRAAATAAPTRPPTSAWLELLGRPAHQVTRFQMIAPRRAHTNTSCEATRGSTRPEAIVVATAVPHKAPIRLVHAAITTAWRGESTLVATTVAMEFAVS